MDRELKALVELQDIDISIIELENSKEEFPMEVERLEGEIVSAQAAVDKLTTQLNDAKKEMNVASERITNAKTVLERSQERINSIKTNKEYDAVHAEIEINKQLVDSGDKKLKKHAETIEGIETSLNEASEKLEKVSTENQPVIDDLKSRIANIDTEIAKVEENRVKIIPEIRKAYIRSYNNIRERRPNGKTLSVITSTDRTCTVCYQKLQPNIFNKARKATELVYCQSCGSILVWQGNVQKQSPKSEEAKAEDA